MYDDWTWENTQILYIYLLFMSSCFWLHIHIWIHCFVDDMFESACVWSTYVHAVVVYTIKLMYIMKS